MSDLIERQKAIDAMCSVCGYDCDKSNFVYDAPQDEQVILCPEHYALTVLPSARPEPCEDAVSRNAIIQKLNTMDRYVSEELRLCDTDKKFPKNEVFIVDDVYEEIVENLPSAQSEPVTNCHDLTAAIEAIERIFDRCEEIEAHLPEGDPDRVGYKMYPDWLTVWKYLHQVPSAQPEQQWIPCSDCERKEIKEKLKRISESRPVEEQEGRF